MARFGERKNIRRPTVYLIAAGVASICAFCVYLLLFAVVLSSSPAPVDFSGGTGEPNHPYQIATVPQLRSIGSDPNLLNKHFVLTRDIDMAQAPRRWRVCRQAVIGPGEDSESGIQGAVFFGTFDGKGHTIENLVIKAKTGYNLGLFGKIGKDGLVRDLNLANVRISSAGSSIAALAGYNRGRITNCHVNGAVSGWGGDWCSGVALLAGTNCGHISDCTVAGSISSGSITRMNDTGLVTGRNRGEVFRCDSSGSIMGEGLDLSIGGLAGSNEGSVSDCHSACDIEANIDRRRNSGYGGLIGRSEGVIVRCRADGSISCQSYTSCVGGLAGSSSGVIIDCCATGNVFGEYANWYMGGLVGDNRGHIIRSYATGNVSGDGPIGGLAGGNQGSICQCYATGCATGGQESYIPVGGLVGDGDQGTVTTSFWDTQTSELTTSKGGTGLTTDRMHYRQAYLGAGWDFVQERVNGIADTWTMVDTGGYPRLAVFLEGYVRRPLQGRGTAVEPYRIATAEDLAAICHYDSYAYYELASDIDLSGITWNTPVVPSFNGTLDGNGFAISNLSMRGGAFLGLFGTLWNDAVVRNLRIENASLAGVDSSETLGVVAAENHGRISNCRIDGDVRGPASSRLGGLVGRNYGTIAGCDPVVYDGPYTVIISDLNETLGFLRFNGMEFDQVWIPAEGDIEGTGAALREFLDSEVPIEARIYMDREFVLANLNQYNREFSGFVRGTRRYIFCAMHLGFAGEPRRPLEDGFTMIMDGGCTVVQVVFDAETKAVVSITCNGMAWIPSPVLYCQAVHY